jgi:hypothetical protein
MSTNENTPEQTEPHDVLLSSYVRAVNDRRDTSDVIGVTLFMGGAVVTGSLVSVHAYFAALADEMGADDSPLAEMFRSTADEITPQADGDPDDDKGQPRYVHLRDAKILLAGGNTIPDNRGVAFRGRLDAIDGWIHGILAEGPS